MAALSPIPAGNYLVFSLTGRLFALPLSAVERVLRAVAVTPLPKAPPQVQGIIDVKGQVVPVINIRRLLEMPDREIGLEDRFMLVHSSRRPLAVIADSVQGLRRLEPDQLAGSGELSFAPYLHGAAELPEGLVLIYDLDRFFSLEEERLLDQALVESAP